MPDIELVVDGGVLFSHQFPNAGLSIACNNCHIHFFYYWTYSSAKPNFLHGNKAAGFRDFHQFHYCNFLCAHADAGVRAILGIIARAVTPSIPANYHTFSLQALAYIFYIALKYWLMTQEYSTVYFPVCRFRRWQVGVFLCISLYVGSAMNCRWRRLMKKWMLSYVLPLIQDSSCS